MCVSSVYLSAAAAAAGALRRCLSQQDEVRMTLYEVRIATTLVLTYLFLLLGTVWCVLQQHQDG